MKQAFTGAKIITMGAEIIENGTLLIEDGFIIDIGANIDIGDAEKIDCTGMTITPGFIDAHAHTGVWGEGYRDDNDGNEIYNHNTAYTRVIDAIHPEDVGFADARRGGVTTIAVAHGSANPIGGQMAIVKSYGKEADKMLVKEPAGVKMALGENPKRVGQMYKRAPNTRMGTAYLIRQAFYDAIDYANEWAHYQALMDKENLKPENERKPVKPPKNDIGKAILGKVLNGEIPVRCHAHRADDIRTAIRLQEEFGYDLIIEHATESWKIKETIVKKNVPVILGPLFTERAKRELHDVTMEAPAIMVKEGATVCLMTDSPFNPINHLRDVLIMCIREGLPEDKALELITTNPAKVLGIDDRVGSLKKGMDADFLVFKGDPLDTRTPLMKTYINGQLVFERN